MRALSAIALLTLIVGVLPAQESRYEEIVKQTVGLIDQIHGVLKTIEDGASADAARVELRKAAEKWVEVRRKEKELPPPERTEKDRLAKLAKDLKIREKVARLLGQVRRVEGIPGGRQALDEISGVLKKPDE